jgi:hypothetical protein
MTTVKVIEFVSSQTKARLRLAAAKAESAHLRRVEEGELTQKESTRILAWDLADIAKTLLGDSDYLSRGRASRTDSDKTPAASRPSQNPACS